MNALLKRHNRAAARIAQAALADPATAEILAAFGANENKSLVAEESGNRESNAARRERRGKRRPDGA
jgi:hypothetical protein